MANSWRDVFLRGVSQNDPEQGGVPLPEAWVIVAIVICGLTLVSVAFLFFDPWARLRRPEQEILLSTQDPLVWADADQEASRQDAEFVVRERELLHDAMAQSEKAD